MLISNIGRHLGALVFCSTLVTGCQDITGKLPAGTIDPKFYNTEESAVEMAKNVRFEFQEGFLQFTRESGLISDELRNSVSYLRTSAPLGVIDILDQRFLPENNFDGGSANYLKTYPLMQRVRSIASLARTALQNYKSDSIAALQGEMLIYQGSAIAMLADLYCSGVPLSTVDFDGDWTYRPGLRTVDLYEQALIRFDSAALIGNQNDSIRMAAEVLRGSVLLHLGRSEEAAQAVSSVADDFQLTLRFIELQGQTTLRPYGRDWIARVHGVSVADREGINGLDFISSRDPRLPVDSLSYNTSGGSRFTPKDRTHAVIASGIEARLIEAEAAALAGEPVFLDILNRLRTDGTFTVSEGGDTIYNSGSGGVAGLSPLNDPADIELPVGKSLTDERIDLVMRERAFWLFLTGRRQGDLRRMIRHYNRDVEDTYPIGPYSIGVVSYDLFTDVPIPSEERYNPHVYGCLGRGE